MIFLNRATSIRAFRPPCITHMRYRSPAPFAAVRLMARMTRSDDQMAGLRKLPATAEKQITPPPSLTSSTPTSSSSSSPSPSSSSSSFPSEITLLKQAYAEKMEAYDKLKTANQQSMPTFRKDLVKEGPLVETEKFEDMVRFPALWLQVVSVVSVSITLYFYSADVTNHETKTLKTEGFSKSPVVTSDRLVMYRVSQTADSLQTGLKQLRAAVSFLPNSVQYFIISSYVKMANAYINCHEGVRVAYQITGVCATVWLLWKIRRIRPIMANVFLHHPLSSSNLPIIFSTFSHKSFIHLGANCWALISFCGPATAYLMREQAKNNEGLLESTPKYHVWALFATAGMFAALVSQVAVARITFPRMVKYLAQEAANVPLKSRIKKPQILPSLGASGAIYSLFIITALAYPDAQGMILFLPGLWIGLQHLAVVAVCADILGIIRGWTLFDHWAHLGGAAFGVFYYYFGPELWNRLRSWKSHPNIYQLGDDDYEDSR